MEQISSWEANNHPASQEISQSLCNLKIHYRFHKGPPLVPILSQMNPGHTLTPYFPKIHSNQFSAAEVVPKNPSKNEALRNFS
jgi:hypothetical protein